VLPVEIRFKDGRPQRVTMTQMEATFRRINFKKAALAKALGLAPKDSILISTPSASPRASSSHGTAAQSRRARQNLHEHVRAAQTARQECDHGVLLRARQ